MRKEQCRLVVSVHVCIIPYASDFVNISGKRKIPPGLDKTERTWYNIYEKED